MNNPTLGFAIKHFSNCINISTQSDTLYPPKKEKVNITKWYTLKLLTPSIVRVPLIRPYRCTCTHHHTQINLSAQFWILFLAIFMIISPNSCGGGASANVIRFRFGFRVTVGLVMVAREQMYISNFASAETCLT